MLGGLVIAAGRLVGAVLGAWVGHRLGCGVAFAGLREVVRRQSQQPIAIPTPRESPEEVVLSERVFLTFLAPAADGSLDASHDRTGGA